MEIRETTSKALDKFGAKAQVIVAMEELCELSSAIAKYPRYENERDAIDNTKEKVLDEYCDVMIVMDTIAQIYGFTPEKVQAHLTAKLERINRWLSSENNTMEVTTKDRAVIEDKPCEKCMYYFSKESSNKSMCSSCKKAQTERGIKLHYKEEG